MTTVANYGKLSDGELFEQLKAETEKLPLNRDPDERRELWREINGLVAEIERRYPPSTAPLS